MNRYNFILFIRCDAYNQLNIDNRLKDHYQSEKFSLFKRKSYQSEESFQVEDDSGYVSQDRTRIRILKGDRWRDGSW